MQSTSTSSSTTSSSDKSPPVGIIVGVVVGAIVLVLHLFLYIRRRINRRAQELNENANPKPFPLIPNPTPNLTYEVPSIIPQLFSSKFSRRRESANAPDIAAGASGSSRPTPSPVFGTRIDPINSAIRNTKTIRALQPSTSAQGGDLEFLQHERSEVRMPNAEGNLDELPPAYTIS